ncbi:MAG: helix-turn-helix transcriptional regulator [Tepidisphaeraceae bacterium]
MPTTSRKTSGDTYFDLVRSFPLRRITSAPEHAKANKIVRDLSGKADRGTRDYVDVLVDLIVDYEKRAGFAIDTSYITAADLVRHKIEERGMSVSALAKQIGMAQSNLSEMLNGNRDWSKSAIRSLSKLLNIRAERFLA